MIRRRGRIFAGGFGPVVTWLLVVWLGGCADQVTHHPGLVTHTVYGQIQLDPDSDPSRSFVVVRRHDTTLIESSTGYLSRLSALVVHPDKDGRYSVRFEPETRQLDLTFIARGFLPVSFSFRRTLGIGSYEYPVLLRKDPQWKDNYFLLIKPALVNVIAESRYRLTSLEQLFLGDWMDETENQLQ